MSVMEEVVYPISIDSHRFTSPSLSLLKGQWGQTTWRRREVRGEWGRLTERSRVMVVKAGLCVAIRVFIT